MTSSPQPPTAEKKMCPNCGGAGTEIVRENRVTLDMAIDAGDRSLEGAFHSYQEETCHFCQGCGYILETT